MARTPVYVLPDHSLTTNADAPDAGEHAHLVEDGELPFEQVEYYYDALVDGEWKTIIHEGYTGEEE